MPNQVIIQTLIDCGAIPAATALAAALALRFLLPHDVGRRDALPVAVVAGFLVGYFLSNAAVLEPKRTWEYLPYLAVLAGLVGAVSIAERIRFYERWSVQLALALLAAYYLTPTWAVLQPVRHHYILSLGAYLFLLTACVVPLGRRTPAPLLTLVLALTGFGTAAVGAAEVSTTISELALIASAATFGCFLATLFGGALDARGMVLPVVILVGGLAFTIHIEPDPPLRAMLLLPLAPLALWLSAIPAVARLKPAARYGPALCLAVAILAAGIVLVVFVKL
jgi:hypothetical protein